MFEPKEKLLTTIRACALMSLSSNFADKLKFSNGDGIEFNCYCNSFIYECLKNELKSVVANSPVDKNTSFNKENKHYFTIICPTREKINVIFKDDFNNGIPFSLEIVS